MTVVVLRTCSWEWLEKVGEENREENMSDIRLLCRVDVNGSTTCSCKNTGDATHTHTNSSSSSQSSQKYPGVANTQHPIEAT